MVLTVNISRKDLSAWTMLRILTNLFEVRDDHNDDNVNVKAIMTSDQNHRGSESVVFFFKHKLYRLKVHVFKED